MKLIILIPAYNEEDAIGSVINKIPDDIFGIDEKEIVVINDGSSDNTASNSKGAGAQVFSHQENKGVGIAFRTGIEQSLIRKADLVVTIDGDGQFNPSDISELIKPVIKKEADFVTASRFLKKEFIPFNMPKIKIWGNKIVSRIVSFLVGKKFYDVTCGFRAYSKEAILNLNLFGDFTYTQETFLDLSFKQLKIKEIPIRVQYFSDRKSRVTKSLLKYIFQVFKIILKTLRDYKPLKFFGSIGIFIFLLGIFADVYIFIYFLKTGFFTPYKFLAFIGGFLNALGVGIFILGLVADMLLRLRKNQEKLLYYQKKKFYEN